MSLDLTAFDAALKQHYTDDRVENMVYQDNPMLALMPKMEEFGGRNLPIPLIYGNPQGRSASFSQAQSRGSVTNSKLSDFLLTRVKDYSIATIDNETLLASEGNVNAFLEAATVEIDGAINSLTRSIGVKSYRDGWGTIGVIGVISTNDVTLATVEDVTNFEVGMVLCAAASASSGNLRGSSPGDSCIVTNVNRISGVITVDSLPGTFTVGDSLSVKGDREYTASTRQVISGLEAWVPASAPSSTAFFGVDRSIDVTRLGGLRLDGTAKPIEEALIEGASLMGREGRKTTHYFMSFSKYADLEKALGSKVQYIDLKMSAEIAFRGIQVHGPKGTINVIPDQNCPGNRVFGLELPMFKIYSLGKAVRVIDTDGLQMLRQASADGVECRYGMYGNLGCRAPAGGINIQV
jgi:hypothetical protein